ncbi:MAG: TRAP transporter permease [Desulfobacteraceae bacterium]|nr:TRAP transporter permease [Desulfobacteraceae bacterium]
MTEKELKIEGIDKIKQMARAEEGMGRDPKGFGKYLIFLTGLLWSLFQLSIASWLILDSIFIRAVHLGFAMTLVFLCFPMFSTPLPKLKFLSRTDKIPVFDYILAATGAFCALYILIDHQGIILRYGLPIKRDIIIGIMLVIILLEASRRVIGPALSIVSIVFCIYAFFGQYMPSIIAFKGVSINRFIGQMTMSSEGIYGIPLDVSANIVFLFVLLGAMLDKAGAGEYFIQLALSLLGRYKGGPAKAAVLGSGLTGTVSGSSIANIVTTGTFTIPMMKKVGYPATKAAAIEVAASTDGQLAPPIMGAAAFIIAEYCNVPYLEVIKAAAIPAFASYAALFYITHIEASKLGLTGMKKNELPLFIKTFLSGIHFILPLAMLVYELVYLRRSPEVAAFHAIWVMGLIMIIQPVFKAVKNKTEIMPSFYSGIKNLLNALSSGARNMVSVALATAAAGIIVGVVALGLGGLITQIIEKISMGNIFLMLAITALASLIIGMGLPTTATYIVMASLTAPAIVAIADAQNFFVPLMAAHLFCFYFGILADDTPPVGLAAYAASAIAKSPPIPTGIQAFTYDIRTAILPFMFIFNTDIILHNINSWTTGILIFIMTCIGNFTFASATQGWLITKNKWYEIPLLLMVTLILMRPELISSWVGISYENRHFAYIFGIILLLALYAVQYPRKKKFIYTKTGF